MSDLDPILLLQVLPLAIGAAISPSVLIVQILVLASGPKGLARAWALAIGLTAALVVLGFVGYTLLSLLPDVSIGRPSAPLAAGEIAAGLVLLAIAVVTHRRPPRDDDHHSATGTRFATMSPWLLVPVGFFWQFTELNTLALYLPAIHIVTNAAAADLTKLLALVLVVVVTSSAWLLPPLSVTLRGESAQRRLDRLHAWLERNERRITIGVCLVFGLGLLVLGLVEFVLVLTN